MIRAARFARHLVRPRPSAVRVEEVPVRVEDRDTEATLFLPARPRPPVPAWVVLHGITVPGRRHASLVRFASSLAASGAVVLVPDVPAWRELRITVHATGSTIREGAHYLTGRPEVRSGGVGVIGFSFGATQALVAAADPAIREHVRTVVGFGGYCDLRRAIRCMMTGEHEWAGTGYTLDPDPYGRWIVAANYLARAVGYQGMERVADGVRHLAAEAGRRGVAATAEEYDPLKAHVRATLADEERGTWDLLAPPAGEPPADLPAARTLGDRLAEAALAAEPSLNPLPTLPSLRGRVVLGHGRGDRLIPFTETLRLHSHLPPEADASAVITGLVAHSTLGTGLRPVAYVREGLGFMRLLRRMLA